MKTNKEIRERILKNRNTEYEILEVSKNNPNFPLLSAVSPYVSTESHRTIMNMILVEDQDDGAQTLTATDGHRLLVIKQKHTSLQEGYYLPIDITKQQALFYVFPINIINIMSFPDGERIIKKLKEESGITTTLSTKTIHHFFHSYYTADRGQPPIKIDYLTEAFTTFQTLSPETEGIPTFFPYKEDEARKFSTTLPEKTITLLIMPML